MNKRTRKHWIHALLWLMLIYAPLPVARPVSAYLRTHIPLSASITMLFVVTLLGLTLHLGFKTKIRLKSTYVFLLIVALSSALIVREIRIPEEKIHFLEYGLLFFLFQRALSNTQRPLAAFVLALLLTGACGWLDEGIQYFLPDRYYDLRDVLFNFLGGTLGLTVTWVIKREEGAFR